MLRYKLQKHLQKYTCIRQLDSQFADFPHGFKPQAKLAAEFWRATFSLASPDGSQK